MTTFKYYLIAIISGLVSFALAVGGGLWITIESSRKYLATHPGHPSPLAFFLFAIIIWLVLMIIYLIIAFICARKLPERRARHFCLGFLVYIASFLAIPAALYGIN
jgi:uncharacterized protein YneF (UPF0154 family)